MIVLRRLLVAVAAAYLATPPAFAQPEDLTIFILAGQSNMSERGKQPMPKDIIVYAQLGQLSKKRRAMPPFAYWETIKKVQAKISIPNSAMISAENYELSSDGIHLSTQGYLMIGRKFADVMHPLMLRQKNVRND